MKKLSFLTLITSMSILLGSCNQVTPVAYTRYIPQNEEEHVYYSSYVYGDVLPHICIWENKEKADANPKSPDISINFSECLGVDTVEDTKYTLVRLKKWYDMRITISKTNNSLFGESKRVYLNGEELPVDVTDPLNYYDSDYIRIFTYDTPKLIRTNPNGKLEYSLVNTVEYK